MNQVEQARQQLGLNIQQMADALKVHRNTYTKWERGEREPRATAITAIDLLLFLHDRDLLEQWLQS